MTSINIQITNKLLGIRFKENGYAFEYTERGHVLLTFSVGHQRVRDVSSSSVLLLLTLKCPIATKYYDVQYCVVALSYIAINRPSVLRSPDETSEARGFFLLSRAYIRHRSNI